MQEEDFKEDMILTCDVIKNKHNNEDNHNYGGNTNNNLIIYV